MSKILITGGAGYIGSHLVLVLLQKGLDVVVLDNLCNSSPESLSRAARIAGRSATFVQGDVRDKTLLKFIFNNHSVGSVVHFAGLKAVEESVHQPLSYYDVNVNGSQTLLQAMADACIFNFVFSSSATVYGNPVEILISEDCPLGRPTNPYGRSKVIVEDILHDLSNSDPRWRVAILRYFNPVGAHESGLMGEDPNGTPTNLMPYIAQVAMGNLPEIVIFGDDYPTLDGTGVRDYIHVMDLAIGHLHAMHALSNLTGIHVWNLGTGKGFSVLEMIKAFQATSGCLVPYRIATRRVGDVGSCCADPTKAENELKWKAERDLRQIMRDTWRWHRMNPNGYR